MLVKGGLRLSIGSVRRSGLCRPLTASVVGHDVSRRRLCASSPIKLVMGLLLGGCGCQNDVGKTWVGEKERTSEDKCTRDTISLLGLFESKYREVAFECPKC